MRFARCAAGAAVLVLVVLVVPLSASAAKQRTSLRHQTQTATVGETVRIGSRSLFGQAGTHPTVSWTLLSEPHDARPRLGRTEQGTRNFETTRPGTYMYSERIVGTGHSYRNLLTVNAVPNDPPIGVTVQTLSDDPRGAIWVDGKPAPNTQFANGIYVDVLARSDRQEVEAGTVPRDIGGIHHLMSIAEKWEKRSPAAGYLMIISSKIGVHPNDIGAFDQLAQRIGVPKLSETQRARLVAGAPWSIIGIPGGAKDSAWVNVGEKAGSPRAGDITGYIEYSTATDRYDYVSPDRPTFDTNAQPGRFMSMTVAGRTYTIYTGRGKPWPCPCPDGYHILALNPYTLDSIQNDFVSSGDRLASVLEHVAHDVHPAPLVFVQSVGNPTSHGKDWAKAADAIQSLGGARLVFLNNHTSHHHYALVGRTGSAASAVEFSSNGEVRLEGGLARSHDMSFLPSAGGPAGGLHPGLISMAYQHLQPFPAFSTPEERAAEIDLGFKTEMCDSRSHCNPRTVYYTAPVELLVAYEGRLRDESWPGPGHGMGDTPAVFDAVKAQLIKEVKAAEVVRKYFETLQKVFQKSNQDRVNFTEIGNALRAEVSAPPGGLTTADQLELASKITALGSAVSGDAGAFFKGASTAFALLSWVSRKQGGPLLADQLHATAENLGQSFQERMYEADAHMDDLARLFVSDYGKLMDLREKLKLDGWKLDATKLNVAVSDLTLAARQWFAQQLLPVGFPWLIHVTPPPPEGPDSANGLSCGGINAADQYAQLHPWKRQPAGAQIRYAINGFRDNGLYTFGVFFFSKRGEGFYWTRGNLSPSEELTNLLFGRRTDPTTGPLELDPLELLSPKVFGVVLQAKDTADDCNLK